MIIYRQDKSILIQPKGRLDLEGSVMLKHHLAEAQTKPYYTWIIDLTHVDLVDSAGLSVLVSGLKLAAENKCRIVLYNPNPSVNLVLEITRLDQVFVVINDASELSQLVERSTPTPTSSLVKAA